MSDLKNAIVKSVSDVSEYSVVEDECSDGDSETTVRSASAVSTSICRPKLYPAVRSFNTSLDHISEEVDHNAEEEAETA